MVFQGVLILRRVSALKDMRLAEHQSRVAFYAGLVASAVCPRSLQVAVMSALCHDVGKIGIPDSVLLKPGRLTGDEWRIVRRHPILGAELTQKAGSDFEVVRAVMRHHERWDGAGYPDALSGGDIPIFSRIISVADAFDAMTTDRPYRKALCWEEALREILMCSGTQFDPEVAEAFATTVERGMSVW